MSLVRALHHTPAVSYNSNRYVHVTVADLLIQLTHLPDDEGRSDAHQRQQTYGGRQAGYNDGDAGESKGVPRPGDRAVVRRRCDALRCIAAMDIPYVYSFINRSFISSRFRPVNR